MKSVRSSDHYVKLEIDPDTLEAISGLFLDISFVVGEYTSELKGMLAIPDGRKEDFEVGSCEVWLWLSKLRPLLFGLLTGFLFIPLV